MLHVKVFCLFDVMINNKTDLLKVQLVEKKPLTVFLHLVFSCC